MGSLSHFKLLGIEIALVILLGLLLSYALKIFRYFKYHHKELRALGFFQEKKKTFIDQKTKVLREKVVKATLQVRWKKNQLIFSKYNHTLAKTDFERLKPHLEHLFHKKIEEITTAKSFFPWQQKKIILHTEAFNEVLPFSDCPKLQAGQFWLGRDGLGRDVILDTVFDFENTMVILAGKGSGKSVFIRSAVKSFFETQRKVGKLEEFQLVFIDAKMTDFLDLIAEYKAKTFNPVFSEELQECVDYLEENKKRVDDYRRYLQENKISVAHWDELRELDVEAKPPKKLFIVIDEAKQFLAVRDSVKITKDSTDQEKALKERYDYEKRLSFLVNNIAEIQRPAGTILVISSQDSRSATYNIDFTNFKTMLLGQQNQAQSFALTGSDIAKDPTLKKGKFIFVGDGEVKKIQTPFSLAESPKKKGDKNVR